MTITILYDIYIIRSQLGTVCIDKNPILNVQIERWNVKYHTLYYLTQYLTNSKKIMCTRGVVVYITSIYDQNGYLSYLDTTLYCTVLYSILLH